MVEAQKNQQKMSKSTKPGPINNRGQAKRSASVTHPVGTPQLERNAYVSSGIKALCVRPPPRTTGPFCFATYRTQYFLLSNRTLAFHENHVLQSIIQNEHITVDTGLRKTLMISSSHGSHPGTLSMNGMKATHWLYQFSLELSLIKDKNHHT